MEINAVRKKVSLKLQISVINTQNNINAELKVEGIDNIDKNRGDN